MLGETCSRALRRMLGHISRHAMCSPAWPHRSLTSAERPCNSTGTTVESRYVRIGAVCRFILFCTPIAAFWAFSACVEGWIHVVVGERTRTHTHTHRVQACTAASSGGPSRRRRATTQCKRPRRAAPRPALYAVAPHTPARTSSGSSAPAPASGGSIGFGSSCGGGASPVSMPAREDAPRCPGGQRVVSARWRHGRREGGLTRAVVCL